MFATEYEDARDTARLSRDLSPEDFLALPKYHAYVNLMAEGHPSGWALVKTLPPPPITTDPERVRAVSRASYATTSAPQTNEASSNAVDTDTLSTPLTGAASIDSERIGRKRRQR